LALTYTSEIGISGDGENRHKMLGKRLSDSIPVMIPYIYLSTYGCKNSSIPLVVNTPTIIRREMFHSAKKKRTIWEKSRQCNNALTKMHASRYRLLTAVNHIS
jgi:hypothetical protein